MSGATGPMPHAQAAAPAARRGPPVLAPAIILGAAACGLAIALTMLETRYMLAAVAGVAALDALLLLGRLSRVRSAMIAAIVMGLSIGLNISFFLHTTVPGAYVPFVGGAEAVTLSLTLCGALGYMAADRMERGRRRWTINHWLVWPQLLFMAAGLLSLLNANEPWLSLLEEIRLACLLLVTLVVMNFCGAEPRLYIKVLALSVILQAALVGAQFASGQSFGLRVFGEGDLIASTVDARMVSRPTGTLSDPNITAYFFEITGPLMLALALTPGAMQRRSLFAVATAAAWFGALLTLSRGAWLALPFCSALVVVAITGRRLFSLRSFLILGALGSVALISAAVARPIIGPRLFGDDGGSTGHRIPLIEAAWSVLSQHPVLGVGLNNFALAFERLDQTGYSRVFQHVDHVVHNLHLLVWTEVGLVGFIAYLLTFGAAFAAAFLLRRAEAAVRIAAIGVAAGLLAHLLHGFVDPGFKLSLVISQLIAAQIGLLGCLLLQARRPRRLA
jgi:O-antigen ligase